MAKPNRTRRERQELQRGVQKWINDGTLSHLRDTNITYLNLRGLKLEGFGIPDVNLTGCNLTGVDFSGVGLSGTNFSRTILKGTILDPKRPLPAISDEKLTNAGLTFNGKWVFGFRTKGSRQPWPTTQKYITYYPRKKPFVAPVFSADPKTSCHPGLYLASKQGLYDLGLSGESLVKVKCLRSELLHTQSKWRAKRLWVLEDEKA